jgi:hypothetical protein
MKKGGRHPGDSNRLADGQNRSPATTGCRDLERGQPDDATVHRHIGPLRDPPVEHMPRHNVEDLPVVQAAVLLGGQDIKRRHKVNSRRPPIRRHRGERRLWT